jgi:hypothetical protein
VGFDAINQEIFEVPELAFNDEYCSGDADIAFRLPSA